VSVCACARECVRVCESVCICDCVYECAYVMCVCERVSVGVFVCVRVYM
jgi:hypothetical protein